MLRKVLLVLAVMLFTSLSALAQATKVGYIHCTTGDQYVYLYDSLGTFNVLVNLKCGERVDIIGSETGYVMVRTADDRQGYVPMAAVTSTPPAKAPAASAASAPATSGASQGAPVDMSGSPAGALEPAAFVTRAEIFGGYSYLNFDTNGLSSRQNFNGWEASVAAHAYRRLDVEGGIGGYYKTYSYNLGSFGTLKVNVHDYAFMGGPRFNLRPVFVHALVGVDHLTQSAQGSSASENSFGAAFGGGGQWRITPKWAVRASADYLITRHTAGLSRLTQNNIRLSGGVVYRFRTRSE